MPSVASEQLDDAADEVSGGPEPGDLTGLLHAWRVGDASSGNRLIEALYRELRLIANRAGIVTINESVPGEPGE